MVTSWVMLCNKTGAATDCAFFEVDTFPCLLLTLAFPIVNDSIANRK